MKKLGSILTGLVILSLGVVFALVMQAGAHKLPIRQYFPSNHTVAVWDWQDPNTRDSRQLSQINEFFYLHQINTVYLDISQFALTGNDPGKKQQLESSIAAYVKAVKSRGVKVFAAAGNPNWSKLGQRSIPLSIQRFVWEYNQDYPSDRLSGIEFDIESYNQTGFPEASTTEKSIVLTELLDTVKQISDAQLNYQTKYHYGLELGFAIPYWFDDENGNIPAVTWGDKTGPTLYHLVDTLNELSRANIVVMAYRNAATGNDGSIFHSRTEVDYAAAKDPNVKVIIGQEVNDVQPAKTTFYGLGISTLSTEVRLITDEFQSDSSYGGIAINDINGLMQLSKNT